jgi:hypothetical protein
MTAKIVDIKSTENEITRAVYCLQECNTNKTTESKFN